MRSVYTHEQNPNVGKLILRAIKGNTQIQHRKHDVGAVESLMTEQIFQTRTKTARSALIRTSWHSGVSKAFAASLRVKLQL